EAAEVGQLDRAALLGRQRLQRAPHLARFGAARRLDVRALLGDELLLDPLVARAMALLHDAAAQRVDRPVVGDPEDPRAHAAAAAVVARPAAPDRQERLLHDVL